MTADIKGHLHPAEATWNDHKATLVGAAPSRASMPRACCSPTPAC